LRFEFSIDDHCVSTFRRDICPLNIPGLLLVDAESWLAHVSLCPGRHSFRTPQLLAKDRGSR
jgi:hypothetical protein